MNSKLIAVLMALIMAASAVAAAMPSGTDATEGDESNPYYIIGSESSPALLYEKDKNGNASAGIKAKMDFNRPAYSIRDDSISFSVINTAGTESALTLGTAKTVDHVKLTVTQKDTTGVYDVSVKYASAGTDNIKIKVSFDTYFEDKDLGLEYYYAISVRSISGSQNGGNAGDNKIAVEGEDVVLKTNGDIDYLKVYKGAVPEFDLKVYAGNDATKKAILDSYYFYAEGLPDGLAVKVDKTSKYGFVITGKVDHSITVNENGYKAYNVKINAADKNGNPLAPLEVQLRVYLSESDFSFTVETEDVNGDTVVMTVNEDVYEVIKAGTPISVKPLDSAGNLNQDVQVFYTDIDGSQKPLTVTGGKYVYTSKATDSGVVEIVMKNSAIQHKVTALIVGNVVHSGLEPVVTSS